MCFGKGARHGRAGDMLYLLPFRNTYCLWTHTGDLLFRLLLVLYSSMCLGKAALEQSSNAREQGHMGLSASGTNWKPTIRQVSEVDELQQRRMRGEKALQAAEVLRQEYVEACEKSDERAARLKEEIEEVTCPS